MIYTLNLREVTYALSEALDFVGIDDTMHGKRVAYMSSEIAKLLGWSQQSVNEIIAMGMLHDCGVSSTDVHSHLVNELDWNNSQIHCIRGEMLLKKSEIYSSYAQTVLYHHTHWNEMPSNIDSATKDFANLIYLTDRVDALRVQIGFKSQHERNEIRLMIKKYSGTMFSPALVHAFLDASCSDSFWYYMESEALHDYFIDWIESGQEKNVNFDVLKHLAIMFADIVDAKSTFTSEHTFGVAALARYLSKLYGLSESQQEKVELSAYFHDLGKLRIADEILHKPGPLNDEERSQMNRHGFDSHLILRKIKGFQEIAKIASMHHETLDAKGYPYHYSANNIPIEARILAVADIFQALVQNRPYRTGLSSEAAFNILEEMVINGKIDKSILDILKNNLDQCYILAAHPLEHI